MTPATRYNSGSVTVLPQASSSKLKRKAVDFDHVSSSENMDERPKKKYKTRSVQRSRRLKYRWKHGYLSTDATTGKMSPQERDEQGLLHPDQKFYYPDGDFYLVVEDVKFRIHLEKLSTAGGMFADFQNLRLLRARDDECIGGIPAVDVPQTPLTEIRYLLAVLYEESVISTVLPNGKPWFYWDLVKNIIPIVDRLNLDNVYKEIVTGLEMLFPSEKVPTSFKPIIGGIDTEDRQKRFYRIFPIEAVNIFSSYSWSYDYTPFLPMAYYHASQLLIDDIMDGVQDGHKLVKLDPQHIPVLLKGREAVFKSRRGVTFSWFDRRLGDYGPTNGSPGCSNGLSQKGREHCYRFFQRLYGHFRKTGFLDGHANALEGLNGNAKGLFKYYMCPNCYAGVLSEAEECLRINWRRLPGYFGLDSWEAVLKHR